MISITPSPPYYAVIFSSIDGEDKTGYKEMDELMSQLVQNQPGFLGYECASSDLNITISFWKDLESIKAWKMNENHQLAQHEGRNRWYKKYKIRICKVERDYLFEQATP